ncbi:hypothetical protein, partial [Saccharicrinis fermentans]
ERLNMGNGQYMTLPQNNSSINITINDNAEEATLVVSAKNNLAQETRETRTKLVNFARCIWKYRRIKSKFKID